MRAQQNNGRGATFALEHGGHDRRSGTGQVPLPKQTVGIDPGAVRRDHKLVGLQQFSGPGGKRKKNAGLRIGSTGGNENAAYCRGGVVTGAAEG